MSAKKKSQTPSPKADAMRMVNLLFKAEHLDKKSFYLHGFLRGIVVGAGTVIGATLLVAILLWVLSLFDTVPFIGPIIDNARETIKEG